MTDCDQPSPMPDRFVIMPSWLGVYDQDTDCGVPDFTCYDADRVPRFDRDTHGAIVVRRDDPSDPLVRRSEVEAAVRRWWGRLSENEMLDIISEGAAASVLAELEKER